MSTIDCTKRRTITSGNCDNGAHATTVRTRLRSARASAPMSIARVANAPRWRTTAAGFTITRAPSMCSRQHTSRSSPRKGICAAKPPTSRKMSLRTNMQAEGKANVSRTASCCCWSRSPGSTTSTSRPVRSASRPTCCSTLGVSHSTNFGPTIAAFDRNASATSCDTTSGCSATSSCKNSKKPSLPSTTAIT